jgi:ribosomal protein L37AE/L43A
MENIVRLSEYRSRRKARRPATESHSPAHPQPGAEYFCTRCDSGGFRLSAAGMVHCAHCGALMRNLVVGPTTLPEAG